MAAERVTLSISLLQQHATLVEKVARLRSRQMDPNVPVDLGAYIFTLLNKDVAACLEEIKARRGA